MQRKWRRPIGLVALVLAGVWGGGCGGDGGSKYGAVDGFVYSVDTKSPAELVVSRLAQPEAGQTPVPEALVTITGSSRTALTQSNGYFKISRVLPGSQTLTVSKSDYPPLQLQVWINKGQTTHVSQLDRKWTLLIYMNADNDLEEFGVQDVNEMEQVGSTDEVAIVVMMDRIRGYDSSNGDWTHTRRFVVRRDHDLERMTSSETANGAEILGELDMGQPATLKAFIEWGREHYPAERYLLDIWDHGSGWRSRSFAAGVTRKVSYDDTSGTAIETVELPYALDVDPRLDIVAMDASLMQMMEVAYEIRHRTGLIVGSQESPPGEGYPYHTWIGPLVADPSMSPRDLARLIVNQTVDTLGSRYDLTQSALDTSQLGGLAQAIDSFAKALIPREAQYREALTRARNNAQRYGSGSSAYATFKDLVDYADQVARETGDSILAQERDKVKAALNQALVAERHSGTSVANSHGLSIYVPPSTDWTSTRSRYRNLAFAQDTHWDEWIDAYAR